MHIWIPKLKIVEAEIVAPKAHVRGWFHAQVFNSSGTLVREYARKNLVTNFFFANLSTSSHSYAAVGTGSPTFTGASTALASQTGSRASFGSNSYYNISTSSWGMYGTADFGLGNINANLTEFGVFTSASGSNMTFCDLIRDGGGSPTTFPVTSSEQLRLTHGFEVSVPTSLSTGSFTIGGAAGSGSHDYEIAAMPLGTPTSLAGVITAMYGGISAIDNVASGQGRQVFRGCTGAGTPNSGNASAYSGSPVQIGSGSSVGTYSGAHVTSTPGERTANSTLVLGLSDANHADGISGVSLASSGSFGASTASCRISISPPIPKFAGSVQRVLTLNFSGTGKAV